MGRSLFWGDRFTVDWRLEASNVLNRVTYAAVNTVVKQSAVRLPGARECDAHRPDESALWVLTS